jgi:hypothetical protein
MKKILIVGFIVLTVFGVISCKTTKPSEPATVNEAFQRVFSEYRDDLILEGAELHIVQHGETLSGLANSKWPGGRGYFFPVIMLASSQAAVIADPDVIEPGMRLTIPDLQRNLDDSRARANIKAYLKDVAGIYERKFAETNDPKHNTTKEELLKLSASL